MEPTDTIELLSHDPVEGKDLPVMRVSGQHQIDAVADRRLPAQGPVVEQDGEVILPYPDVGEVALDLVVMLRVVNTDELYSVANARILAQGDDASDSSMVMAFGRSA